MLCCIHTCVLRKRVTSVAVNCQGDVRKKKKTNYCRSEEEVCGEATTVTASPGRSASSVLSLLNPLRMSLTVQCVL